MKRYVKSVSEVRKWWEEVVYLYDLIVTQKNESYIDDYISAWFMYESAGGGKGYSINTRKYLDLYTRLAHSYMDYDSDGNKIRVYPDDNLE